MTIEIIGPTAGLQECPDCNSEVQRLEDLILTRDHLIGFFAELKYPEQKRTEGLFFKREVTYVDLECGGILSFIERNGQIHNIQVEC